MTAAHDPRRRSAWSLLLYGVIVAMTLTMNPFDIGWRIAGPVFVSPWSSDFLENVVFFLPLGFLFRMALDSERGGSEPQALDSRAVLMAGMCGACLSLVLELIQLTIPGRVTAVADVIANGTGAALGAWVARSGRAWLRARLPAVSGMGHPLVNLLFLLLPLLWLAALPAAQGGSRMALLLPLGAMGSIAIAAVWCFRFRAVASWRHAVAFASLWLIGGAAVSLLAAPGVTVMLVGVLATVCLLSMGWFRFLQRLDPTFRRIEPQALSLIWPCFVGYLALLVLGSHGGTDPGVIGNQTFSLSEFDVRWNTGYAIKHTNSLLIVEHFGALTVFGYLVAESLGRVRLSPATRTNLAVALCGAVVVAIECAYGLRTDSSGSVVRGGLALGASIYGTCLYRWQLNAVQLLRAEPFARSGASRSGATRSGASRGEPRSEVARLEDTRTVGGGIQSSEDVQPAGFGIRGRPVR